jgi:hypothetical protein
VLANRVTSFFHRNNTRVTLGIGDWKMEIGSWRTEDGGWTVGLVGWSIECYWIGKEQMCYIYYTTDLGDICRFMVKFS